MEDWVRKLDGPGLLIRVTVRWRSTSLQTLIREHLSWRVRPDVSCQVVVQPDETDESVGSITHLRFVWFTSNFVYLPALHPFENRVCHVTFFKQLKMNYLKIPIRRTTNNSSLTKIKLWEMQQGFTRSLKVCQVTVPDLIFTHEYTTQDLRNVW